MSQNEFQAQDSGKKKAGRKPVVIDLANYCCPKCHRKNVNKVKGKNKCVECHRIYCREHMRGRYIKKTDQIRKSTGDWSQDLAKQWQSLRLR